MNGIFQYSTHFKDKFQTYCSLNEGNTPVIEAIHIAKALGINHLYLKDETTNPSNSFKDRATAYQLSYWATQGKNHFVISSSGNAAISLAVYATHFHVYADIFISTHTAAYKLQRLHKAIGDSSFITIHSSLKPKKEAIQFALKNNFVNLTGSKDREHALIGYTTLGYELSEQLNNQEVDAVFMPTSSGTGLSGLAKGFSQKPAYYAIQTTKKHPIADHFDSDFTQTDSSLATAIVANVIPQKNDLIKMLKDSQGGAYAISDAELTYALAMSEKYEQIVLSYDSALALAGLIKAVKQQKHITSAICILTGI